MNIGIDSAELAGITQTLATRALGSGSVFRTSLDAGLAIFAYPAKTELLIGIGMHRDKLDVYTIENALSRRFVAPQRYACWLPALFADGGFYVMQRIRRSESGDARVPTTTEISDALALFAA